MRSNGRDAVCFDKRAVAWRSRRARQSAHPALQAASPSLFQLGCGRHLAQLVRIVCLLQDLRARDRGSDCCGTEFEYLASALGMAGSAHGQARRQVAVAVSFGGWRTPVPGIAAQRPRSCAPCSTSGGQEFKKEKAAACVRPVHACFHAGLAPAAAAASTLTHVLTSWQS